MQVLQKMSGLVGGVKLDCTVLHTDIDSYEFRFIAASQSGVKHAEPPAQFLVALPHVAPSDAVVSEPARVAPEKGGGYHLSAHVKQYYKTTQL